MKKLLTIIVATFAFSTTYGQCPNLTIENTSPHNLEITVYASDPTCSNTSPVAGVSLAATAGVTHVAWVPGTDWSAIEITKVNNITQNPIQEWSDFVSTCVNSSNSALYTINYIVTGCILTIAP